MQGPSSILNLHRWRRTHWVWHLVLAVFMLWGQVAVARHSLQHVRQADHDALHTTCLQCLALHAVDQAGPTPATTALVPPAPLAQDSTQAAVWPVLALAGAPYLSRAPPPLSA